MTQVELIIHDRLYGTQYRDVIEKDYKALEAEIKKLNFTKLENPKQLQVICTKITELENRILPYCIRLEKTISKK